MSVIRTEQLWERDSRTIAVESLGLGIGEDEGYGFLVPNRAGKTTISIVGITPAASAVAIVAFERRDLLGV